MPRCRSTKEKLSLLKLAESQNISEACRSTGFSRDSYYRIKKQFEKGGIDALRPAKHAAAPSNGRIPSSVVQAVMEISLRDPTLGKDRVSKKIPMVQAGRTNSRINNPPQALAEQI